MKTALILLATSMIAGSASAQPATSLDRTFVATVSQGGMFEVAAGRLATSRGSTQDVRDLAIAEVHDHTLVGTKLKQISKAEGVVFGPALNATFTEKLKHLSSLSGRAFDAAYLSEMATLHDGDGAAFAKEATTGGSAAYRAFGAETHRIVQRHIGAIRAVGAA